MISVLVADDQALIRQAVTDILAGETDMNVIGQARDGEEAVTLADQLHPDVILMDIRMPELDGIGATTRICTNPALTSTRVLILTTFEEDEYLVAALRAGASGFIGKGAEPDEICHAVRAIHAGDALLSATATRNLITKYILNQPQTPPLPPTSPAKLEHLTQRERQVLLLVARGHSNQEIAEDLFISPLTSKTHVNRIMTKLDAHDRAQLVILAYENGLLSPGGTV